MTFDIISAVAKDIIAQVQSQEKRLATHAAKFDEETNEIRRAFNETRATSLANAWSDLQAAVEAVVRECDD